MFSTNTSFCSDTNMPGNENQMNTSELQEMKRKLEDFDRDVKRLKLELVLTRDIMGRQKKGTELLSAGEKLHLKKYYVDYVWKNFKMLNRDTESKYHLIEQALKRCGVTDAVRKATLYCQISQEMNETLSSKRSDLVKAIRKVYKGKFSCCCVVRATSYLVLPPVF
jgi:hypothetical protein